MSKEMGNASDPSDGTGDGERQPTAETRRDADAVRAELYEIMQAEVPFEEKAEQALELGTSYLGVDNGHLTRIDPDTDYWTVLESTDPPDGDFPVGLVLDYRTTYCRRVLEADRSVSLQNAPDEGWEDDPAFETHGLHCYHGSPLTVDGEQFGTVCFVSETPREQPFEESETMFAELVARLLEFELYRDQRTREIELQSGLAGALNRVLRHNLRNDLNVVRLQLEMLQQEDDIGQAPVEKIDELLELSETARQLETVLDTDQESHPVEVTRLINGIAEGMRATNPDSQIDVVGPESVMLEAMPSFEVAIRELLENAAKHADPEPSIEVDIESADGNVTIRIHDDGPGLPDAERAVLESGSESPLVHGSGLGLWIVHWVIENHDGSIEVPTVNRGTEIVVEMPSGLVPEHHGDYEEMLRAFRRDRERFEAIFEAAGDAIVVVDDAGTYVEVNPAAEDLFGVPAAELLGRSISEFAPAEAHFEDTWRAFQQSERSQGRFPLVRPDGQKRIVEYTAVTDLLPGEHLSVLRDVTETAETVQVA